MKLQQTDWLTYNNLKSPEGSVKIAFFFKRPKIRENSGRIKFLSETKEKYEVKVK